MDKEIKIFSDQMEKVLELLESVPTDSGVVQEAIDYIKHPKQRQARSLATALLSAELAGMECQRDVLRSKMNEMLKFYSK